MAGRFNIEDYEPVAERLARAHAKYPDLRVITDIHEIVRSEDGRPIQYVVKGQIWIGDVLKAQDWADEIVGSSMVNKTSALENACTSATGRALANMGFAGLDKNSKIVRPSREEMEKVARYENEKINNPEVRNLVTPDQVIKVKNLLSYIQNIKEIDLLKRTYDEAKAENLLYISVEGSTLATAINKIHKKLVLEGGNNEPAKV